jgi:hypothetical protein
MSENRHGPNDRSERDTSRTPSDHETARTRKVTPDNSVLKNEPDATRDLERRVESHGQQGEHTRSSSEKSVYERDRERASSDPARQHQSRAGGAEFGTLNDESGRARSEEERYREYDDAGHRPGGGYGDGDHERSRYRDWRDDERRARSDRPQATVTTLLRDLATDAAEITRKEVALARNEIAHALSDVKTGIISTATGGGVLFAGFLFLLLAATLGLAEVMPGWLAALIVGGVVALIGVIMVMTGQSKLQAENFRPDRTVDAMRKDREMLARRTR